MRNKRTFLILMLVIFSFAAIHLCPCAAAQMGDHLRFSKSHDCCDRMPNCPMGKCSEYGLMSMLPLFALKIGNGIEMKTPILQHQASIEAEQVSRGFFQEQDLKTTSPPQIFSLSAPKLFIKNLVLRI